MAVQIKHKERQKILPLKKRWNFAKSKSYQEKPLSKAWWDSDLEAHFSLFIKTPCFPKATYGSFSSFKILCFSPLFLGGVFMGIIELQLILHMLVTCCCCCGPVIIHSQFSHVLNFGWPLCKSCVNTLYLLLTRKSYRNVSYEILTNLIPFIQQCAILLACSAVWPVIRWFQRKLGFYFREVEWWVIILNVLYFFL